MDELYYKLCFYVPTSHVEQVKNAIFEAGAGHMGDYDACCFQTLGQGQFRPLEGSNPYIGETGGDVEVVEELVNMITTQRAYEMNSKVVSATDQMLQFITNNIG